MQNNSVNNIILIIGLAIVAATPLFVSLFVSPLAAKLCVNQNLEDLVVCTPNIIPAYLITIFVPILVGTLLIIVSVLSRKK